MRTMTRDQIEKDWSGLQKRHRMEVAQAVVKYCIGRTIGELADILGQSKTWVQHRIDMVGVSSGAGGPSPDNLVGKSRGVQEDCHRVAREFAPNAEVVLKGPNDQKYVESIKGEDAEQFQPYVNYYLEEGHSPATATRLAKAEWAGEAAVEAGVIQEAVTKKNERVNQILFPTEKQDSFDLDLKQHLAKVKAAARFIDEANIDCLKRESTRKKVAEVNEAWAFQFERVLNLKPTFEGE